MGNIYILSYERVFIKRRKHKLNTYLAKLAEDDVASKTFVCVLTFKSNH